MAEIIEEGEFPREQFAEELERAPDNLDVGTSLVFSNERVKVWEVRLRPGERAPFHAHTRDYFWTVVDGGVGKQRSPDGTFRVRNYEVGDTSFSTHSPEEPTLHDFENAGESQIRFVTVELLA
jgi:beta-alanine degradation protein BauB